MFNYNDNFLTKTQIQGSLNKLRVSMAHILTYAQWPVSGPLPQHLTSISINLKRTELIPVHEKWTGLSGRLTGIGDDKVLVRQQDFTIWNEEVPKYIKKLVNALEEEYNFRSGRVRLSNLKSMVCLNTHADLEQRFHLAITTNPRVFFYNNTFEVKNTQYSSLDQLDNFSGVGYHIPADGFFYKSNTFFPHTAINSGWTDRVHLVVDICPPDQL